MNCRVCDWYPFAQYLQCSYTIGEVFQLPIYPDVKYIFLGLCGDPIGYNEGDPIYLAEFVGYGDRYAHIITTHVNKSFVLQSTRDLHRSPIQIKVHLVYISSLCILLILLLWK